MDLNKAQYKFVCELLWGGLPTAPKEQIMESGYFKTGAPILLEKYPQLDKSFFEIHKNDVNNGKDNSA